MLNAVIGYREADVVPVETLFELDGLCVHRSIINRQQVKDEVYTVSSVRTGCAVVIAVDGQARAIECCQWIVAEAAKVGDSFSSITAHLRDEVSDRRLRLLKIAREARENFIEDDEDSF